MGIKVSGKGSLHCIIDDRQLVLSLFKEDHSQWTWMARMLKCTACIYGLCYDRMADVMFLGYKM